MRRILQGMMAGVVLAAVAATAQARDVTVKVRYLSAEHVYLDGGALDGLKVGMRGEVRRGERTSAVLEIVFTADHSAACEAPDPAVDLKVGDEVVFTVEDAESGDASPPADIPETPSRVRTVSRAVPAPTESAGPPASRLTGSVGVTWDHTSSGSDLDLQTDYWSLPFRFKVENLGTGWELRARGSLRRFERSGYSGSTPDGEWRNRIREIALYKGGRDDPWRLALGRVRSRETSAAGPFDGLLAQRRLGGDTYCGIFGGFTPEWGTYAFGTDDHVTGVTFHSRVRNATGRFADAVVTALGRYRGGEISREYLTWSFSLHQGGRWNLLQAGEVDLNRGWRKAAAGRTLSVTGIALSGGMQVSRRLRLDLGYDNRELVRTWESRSLPDSLFRDSGRKGLRTGMNLRVGRRGRLRLSGSIRRDDDLGRNTVSWLGRYDQSGLGGGRLGLHLVVRGFDGPYLKGWAPQGGVSVSRGADRYTLDAGGYVYDGVDGGSGRSNAWARLGWSRDFGQGWSGAAEYRRDWGDDIVGGHWYLDVHHRF